LLILGQWKVVLAAVILSVCFPFAYLIVGLIQMPFLPLFSYAENKNKKKLGLTAGFINLLIGHAIILIYVFFIFDIAIGIASSTNLSIIAFLLFGYGVATGPFSYMASKEGADATGSFLAVFV